MTYISAELRQLVRERAKGYCEYCRMPDEDSFRAHEIDHIEAEKLVAPRQKITSVFAAGFAIVIKEQI